MLEEKLAENTAALKELTAAIEAMAAKKPATEAMAAKKPAAKKPAAKKPEEKEESFGAYKTKAKPNLKETRERLGQSLDGVKCLGDETKEEREANLVAMNEFFGIPGGKFLEAHMLKQAYDFATDLLNGKGLNLPEESEEIDEDEDSLV